MLIKEPPAKVIVHSIFIIVEARSLLFNIPKLSLETIDI